MKKIIMLLLLPILFYTTCAHAEEYTSVSLQRGRWVDGLCHFSVSYNAQKDTYWVMGYQERIIFGINIPLFPRYQVYCIDGSLTTAKRVFSTGHGIYRILAHGDHLYYKREVLFDPMSNNTFCYNTKTDENEKCMPGWSRHILSVSSKELIYFEDGGLYSYDIEQQRERLISTALKLISCDSKEIYYYDENKEVQKYCLGNGTICDISFPDDVDYIWNGYGINQSKGVLYSPTGNTYDISYLKDADDFDVTEGILYAYFAKTNSYIYAFLDEPLSAHQVKFELAPGWDIGWTGTFNVANGKMFGLSVVNDKGMLVSFDARTEETTIVPLP